MPTLAEVIDAFPTVRLNIEVKQVEPPIVERVVEMLVDRGATERALVATGNDDIMLRLRPSCAARNIPTNLAAGEVADFVQRVQENRLGDYRPPGAALQVPPEWKGVPVITAATVEAAHRLGLEVHAWTINEEEEMERLLALGVDGIMTDIPALGHEIISRYGMRNG